MLLCGSPPREGKREQVPHPMEGQWGKARRASHRSRSVPQLGRRRTVRRNPSSWGHSEDMFCIAWKAQIQHVKLPNLQMHRQTHCHVQAEMTRALGVPRTQALSS